MFEEEDHKFFDELYQLWSKTSEAESRYWMPEAHFDNSGRFNIYAVSRDEAEPRKLIASGLSERDADFVTALHGAVPDLIRRLHEALDEADRADHDRDSRECRIAELELQVEELSAK